MNDFISVTTKMNFEFKVELDAIKAAVNDFLSNQEAIELTNEPKIEIVKNNLEISISFKLKKSYILSFEVKKMLFMLEQRLNSLINVKPSNINLIYEGIKN